jgi:hypothetical protein
MTEPTFEDLTQNKKVYYWETPEYLKKQELAKKRNMHAYHPEVAGIDTIFRPVPGANCQWCGKPLQGKCKSFCRPILTGEKDYLGNPILDYLGKPRKIDVCGNAFFAYWYSVPKFKRAIYLRDNFTCQYCGLKPTFKNKHGIELPDLSKLAIDHIHPIAKDGKTTLTNLCVSCRKCNYKKGAKTNWIPQPQLINDTNSNCEGY